jgi:hypothetical protein
MLVLLASVLLGASGPSFHVSPNGDDTATGTGSHPFKTLERARDAVRAYRLAHAKLDKPITVVLSKGTHERSTPFELKPEDSGSAASPTIYRGDHATVSGGRQIRGFHLNEHGWWTVTLPEVKSGQWNFSQLFVNGQRRYRPRFPSSGYFNIASEAPPSEKAKGHGFDRFVFKSGDLDKSWHNLDDVELLCFHTWDMSRMRIGSIDDTTNVVTTTGPTGYDAGWANFPKGNRYIVENVREALGQPGQWYLDRHTGELTYIPLPGETPETAVVVAPKIDQLVDVKGDVARHAYVDQIQFEGIAFDFTNWTLPAQGRFFPQAEVDLSAAIHAEGWRNGVIKNCTVSHVGEYGLEFIGGCRDLLVENCTLSDLGAGGVKLGETRMYDDEADTAQHITVTNNVITDGGRLHPAAIGVWIGQSSHDEVSHNEISDFYYTGVSIGWTWGYSNSQAHDDLIAFNDIHNIGQGVLSDMGGIYTLGIEPGTRLVGNRIHDVDSFSYGGWGIYPDEGSSHEVIEDNVVYRTKSGGYHQHYGEANIVRNNIFAFAREAEIIRTRAEDHLSFTFEHNIVFWKNAPLLGSNWSGNQYKLDNNLYWRTDGKPIDFAGMTLAQWQAKGQDVHSHIADPMFENPTKDDFRLKKNSPAFALGFKNIPPIQPGPLKRSKPTTLAPPAFPVMSSAK